MKLPVMCGETCWAVNTQTGMLCELNHKLDVILEENRRLAVVPELTGRMDKNLEKLQARLDGN